MTAKSSMLAIASGVLLLFSSCQKDVLVEDQAVQSESSSNATAADNVVETAPPVWSTVVTNVNGNVAGFGQGVPARYSSTTKKYPLIVFIHGIGELGTTVGRLSCCGLPSHLKNGTFPANFNVGGVNYSFLVIAPQFKVRPSAADVQSVIDYAKRRWRVDETRVYVSGLSMGGGSTWDWSAVYGQNAAAIVPVCGGTRPTTAMASNIAKKNLPIWGLYSSADAVVPIQWGKDFFNWIDQYNTSYASKTKLTIWTDVNHNSTWGRAFNPATKVDGYNIYQWMLLWKRGTTTTTSPTPAPAPAPAPTPAPTPVPTGNKPPVANAGKDQSIPKSWNWYPNLNANRSYDSDGYVKAILWTQVSGPTKVSFANARTGNTKVYGWAVGTYYFRVAVSDNHNVTSWDDVIIKITNN